MVTLTSDEAALRVSATARELERIRAKRRLLEAAAKASPKAPNISGAEPVQQFSPIPVPAPNPANRNAKIKSNARKLLDQLQTADTSMGDASNNLKLLFAKQALRALADRQAAAATEAQQRKMDRLKERLEDEHRRQHQDYQQHLALQAHVQAQQQQAQEQAQLQAQQQQAQAQAQQQQAQAQAQQQAQLQAQQQHVHQLEAIRAAALQQQVLLERQRAQEALLRQQQRRRSRSTSHMRGSPRRHAAPAEHFRSADEYGSAGGDSFDRDAHPNDATHVRDTYPRTSSFPTPSPRLAAPPTPPATGSSSDDPDLLAPPRPQRHRRREHRHAGPTEAGVRGAVSAQALSALLAGLQSHGVNLTSGPPPPPSPALPAATEATGESGSSRGAGGGGSSGGGSRGVGATAAAAAAAGGRGGAGGSGAVAGQGWPTDGSGSAAAADEAQQSYVLLPDGTVGLVHTIVKPAILQPQLPAGNMQSSLPPHGVPLVLMQPGHAAATTVAAAAGIPPLVWPGMDSASQLATTRLYPYGAALPPPYGYPPPLPPYGAQYPPYPHSPYAGMLGTPPPPSPPMSPPPVGYGAYPPNPTAPASGPANAAPPYMSPYQRSAPYSPDPYYHGMQPPPPSSHTPPPPPSPPPSPYQDAPPYHHSQYRPEPPPPQPHRHRHHSAANPSATPPSAVAGVGELDPRSNVLRSSLSSLSSEQVGIPPSLPFMGGSSGPDDPGGGGPGGGGQARPESRGAVAAPPPTAAGAAAPPSAGSSGGTQPSTSDPVQGNGPGGSGGYSGGRYHHRHSHSGAESLPSLPSNSGGSLRGGLAGSMTASQQYEATLASPSPRDSLQGLDSPASFRDMARRASGSVSLPPLRGVNGSLDLGLHSPGASTPGGSGSRRGPSPLYLSSTYADGGGGGRGDGGSLGGGGLSGPGAATEGGAAGAGGLPPAASSGSSSAGGSVVLRVSSMPAPPLMHLPLPGGGGGLSGSLANAEGVPAASAGTSLNGSTGPGGGGGGDASSYPSMEEPSLLLRTLDIGSPLQRSKISDDLPETPTSRKPSLTSPWSSSTLGALGDGTAGSMAGIGGVGAGGGNNLPSARDLLADVVSRPPLYGTSLPYGTAGLYDRYTAGGFYGATAGVPYAPGAGTFGGFGVSPSSGNLSAIPTGGSGGGSGGNGSGGDAGGGMNAQVSTNESIRSASNSAAAARSYNGLSSSPQQQSQQQAPLMMMTAGSSGGEPYGSAALALTAAILERAGSSAGGGGGGGGAGGGSSGGLSTVGLTASSVYGLNQLGLSHLYPSSTPASPSGGPAPSPSGFGHSGSLGRNGQAGTDSSAVQGVSIGGLGSQDPPTTSGAAASPTTANAALMARLSHVSGSSGNMLADGTYSPRTRSSRIQLMGNDDFGDLNGLSPRSTTAGGGGNAGGGGGVQNNPSSPAGGGPQQQPQLSPSRLSAANLTAHQAQLAGQSGQPQSPSRLGNRPSPADQQPSLHPTVPTLRLPARATSRSLGPAVMAGTGGGSGHTSPTRTDHPGLGMDPRDSAREHDADQSMSARSGRSGVSVEGQNAGAAAGMGVGPGLGGNGAGERVSSGVPVGEHRDVGPEAAVVYGIAGASYSDMLAGVGNMGGLTGAAVGAAASNLQQYPQQYAPSQQYHQQQNQQQQYPQQQYHQQYLQQQPGMPGLLDLMAFAASPSGGALSPLGFGGSSTPLERSTDSFVRIGSMPFSGAASPMAIGQPIELLGSPTKYQSLSGEQPGSSGGASSAGGGGGGVGRMTAPAATGGASGGGSGGLPAVAPAPPPPQQQPTPPPVQRTNSFRKSITGALPHSITPSSPLASPSAAPAAPLPAAPAAAPLPPAPLPAPALMLGAVGRAASMGPTVAATAGTLGGSSKVFATAGSKSARFSGGAAPVTPITVPSPGGGGSRAGTPSGAAAVRASTAILTRVLSGRGEFDSDDDDDQVGMLYKPSPVRSPGSAPRGGIGGLPRATSMGAGVAAAAAAAAHKAGAGSMIRASLAVAGGANDDEFNF